MKRRPRMDKEIRFRVSKIDEQRIERLTKRFNITASELLRQLVIEKDLQFLHKIETSSLYGIQKKKD